EIQAAGADEIQLDEPGLRQDPAAAKRYAAKAIDRALEGLTVSSAVHLCRGTLSALAGKQIILGVIDLGDRAVETAELVAARIRAALPFVAADRLIAAPDCGMKYL